MQRLNYGACIFLKNSKDGTKNHNYFNGDFFLNMKLSSAHSLFIVYTVGNGI
jgi:hypothetical protein